MGTPPEKPMFDTDTIPHHDGETVYEKEGYEDREDYLRCLAGEYEVDLDTVKQLAFLLGETEDFDGLVTSVQDLVP